MNLSFRARTALAATFASTALLACAAPALAAPPANDNLADAQPIGPALPVTVAGTTAEATAEPGEPSPTFLAQPFNSVWYSLDVPAEGDYADIVTISACGESGSGNDYIDVYAVTGPGFGGLDRQDRFLSNGACTFTFVVSEGTQYRIVVDRANDGGAPHELSVTEYSPPPGPANDDFADAQELGPELPVEGIAGSTIDASPEIGEPSHGNYGQAYRSVWYALNVPAEGDYADVVTFKACPEFGGNNVVSVYAVEGEGFGGLVEVGQAVDEQDCAFTFAVTEGTDYRIAVDNINGGEDYELSVLANDPPPNDMFEDRELIPSVLPQEVPGTNVDASAEEDEPEHDGMRPARRSVWYEWTSDFAGRVKIDVCDAEVYDFPEDFFPADIAVYVAYGDGGEEEEGDGGDPELWDLNQIASNGEDGGCTLIFDPADASGEGGGEARRAGPTTFFIAIDSFAEADFNLNLTVAPSGPANDDIADRRTIPSSLPQTVTGSTVSSSAEEDEPEHGDRNARRSVWFQWTAETTDPVTIEVCDHDFEEVAIAVYVDDGGGAGTPEMTDLEEIATNNRNGCTVTFDPTAAPEGGEMRLAAAESQTFFIAVDSGEEPEGEFTLLLRAANPPSNDDFADAIEVGPSLPVSEGGDTIESTREADEPQHGGAGSVWYSWTSEATQTVIVNTCADPDFNTAIGVYTGSQLGMLDEVADDESCPAGRGRKVTFTATTGTEYMIAIGGFGDHGNFTLGIQVPGTAPDVPTVTGVSPASGSNDNAPKVTGTATAGSTVHVFADSNCSDFPFWTGTAAEFNSTGIEVEVEDDTTTTFYASAANADGASACSTTSVTYSEVTPDVPPDAPAFTSSSPASGANDNDPELIGTAEDDSTVRIYTNATCTGAVAGTGSAEDFSSAGGGITVHVADNTTTAFYATAQNAYGTSPCSSSFLSYQEVSGGSTPPPGGGQPPVETDPGPAKVKCPKGKVLKKGKCVKKKRRKKK